MTGAVTALAARDRLGRPARKARAGSWGVHINKKPITQNSGHYPILGVKIEDLYEES